AHWLCDGLPKVAEMNEELDKYTLLLPPYFKTNSLYLDTLSFFKIQKTEYLKEETLTTAPDLYVASHLASTGNFNPKNIKKLRDIVLPQITEPLVKNEYIYISRAKTNKRFVENENQITNYLTENNFKIIYSEEYSFKEQLQIVYNAKVVVTIHGAALALTMFMKKGTHVLEFRKNKDTINNMYYSLCQAAGINYSYLFCESKEISEVGNNFNLIVDPKELKIALDKIRQ
ncbi:MAG: glycosyltransferase family 61 protein, partial [Bacteroidia bacterium]